MKIPLFILLASYLFLCACSKDNSNIPANPQDQLVAKWSLIKLVEKFKDTGEEQTQPFDEGSYIRFDNNGICYAFVDGESYSANWKYVDNKTGIWIDNSNGFDVNNLGYSFKTLTNRSLILLSKEDSDIAEQTIHLEK